MERGRLQTLTAKKMIEMCILCNWWLISRYLYAIFRYDSYGQVPFKNIYCKVSMVTLTRGCVLKTSQTKCVTCIFVSFMSSYMLLFWGASISIVSELWFRRSSLWFAAVIPFSVSSSTTSSGALLGHSLVCIFTSLHSINVYC